MQRKRNWWVKQYNRGSVLSRAHAPGPFPYVFVLDRLKAGFNVPKVLRTANVLGAREVHLVGIGIFDPSPAKGGFRHTRTRVFDDARASLAALRAEGYTLWALHARGDDVLGHVELPERSAFIVGHEEWGLSFDPETEPGVRTLRIPQYGLVRSLNVSIAASLAAFEWTRQHAPVPPPPPPGRTRRVRGAGSYRDAAPAGDNDDSAAREG